MRKKNNTKIETTEETLERTKKGYKQLSPERKEKFGYLIDVVYREFNRLLAEESEVTQ